MDTAILLCGVLTCCRFFHHDEIAGLSYSIFNRVDWTWLSEDTSLLPHGWMPEVGFLPYRWDGYSELMMMYLVELGSSSHPLPAETWNAWKRVLRIRRVSLHWRIRASLCPPILPGMV